MSLKIGIVGLPNVGKSTLFNALTASRAADAANYPFCTIDPNVGVVAVPDARLEKLSAICESGKIIPTTIEFVDIVPPTINTPEETALVFKTAEALLGKANLIEWPVPTMGGEDFGFFLEKVPGCYFFMGNGTP